MPGETGGPIPIRLGGREFLFSPLTDKDYDTVNEYIRSAIIKTASDYVFSVEMDDRLRSTIITNAVTSAAGESFITPPGMRILGTIDGMAFLTWVSIRKENPEITPLELSRLLSDPSNLAQVNIAFERANAITVGMIAKKGKSPRPNRKRRTPKKQSSAQKRRKIYTKR